jgi:hypothetical protein
MARYNRNSSSGKADLHWDNIAGCYKLKLSSYNPDVVTFIKGLIPASDRDFDYETKEWYVKEKYKLPILAVLEQTIGKYNINIVEKPSEDYAKKFNTGASNVGESLPVDDCLLIFSKHTSVSTDKASKFTLAEAQKVYRLTAMKLHPDRNPNGAVLMSELNEAWAVLKEKYFKKEIVNA